VGPHRTVTRALTVGDVPPERAPGSAERNVMKVSARRSTATTSAVPRIVTHNRGDVILCAAENTR